MARTHTHSAQALQKRDIERGERLCIRAGKRDAGLFRALRAKRREQIEERDFREQMIEAHA